MGDRWQKLTQLYVHWYDGGGAGGGVTYAIITTGSCVNINIQLLMW